MKDGGKSSIVMGRIVVVGLLFAVPLAYLTYEALWDPTIEFLIPSQTAGWALHPEQEILNVYGTPVSKDVLFRRVFRLDSIPQQASLRIRAFTEMTVVVNSRELPTSRSKNWKQSTTLDVTEHLSVGDNVILIKVHNNGAVPALWVGEPDLLATPGEWEAALSPQFFHYHHVVSPLLEAPPEPLTHLLEGGATPLMLSEGWKWFFWLLPAWAITLMLINRLVPVELFTRLKHQKTRLICSPYLQTAIPALVIGLSLWLNLYNAVQYPYELSRFDWHQHVEYIKYMAQNWSVPTASEGFMMFQPPLYYFCASLVYRLAHGITGQEAQALKCVQFIGALSGVGLSIFAWLITRRLWPHIPPAQWLALIFASFIPMNLYMNPIISNEVFAAMMIAGAFYALICLPNARNVIGIAGIAGCVVGLALLSKFTALFTFGAGSLFLLFRATARKKRSDFLALGIYLGCALLVCGWFYTRNVMIYGDPFIGSWDVFHFEQNPGYRSLGFYFSFGSVFSAHPERLTWISWLDGNYGSMWADVYRHFFRAGDERTYFWVGIVYVVAILPTLSILLGLLLSVISTIRRPANNSSLLLSAVSLWTWQALILYSMELPFSSTIKAFYFLSLIPILSVYLIQGRQRLGEWMPSSRIPLDISLIVLSVLGIYLYRFPTPFSL